MNLHEPVMLPEVLQYLDVKPNGIYVDATFGAGGYTREILKQNDSCRVLAFDRDPHVAKIADELTAQYGKRFHFIQSDYANMAEHISDVVDGIVFDVGVSSMQLDSPERGFSFQKDGPLDMRMGAGGQSAADLVNTMDQSDLADVIWQYGEDRAARRIAAAIVRVRQDKPFSRTLELAEVVKSAVGQGGKVHPATRTFQALRIAVNDELGQLKSALAVAEGLIRPQGRLVVVTFHSLEDRLVKRFMAERSGKRRGISRHQPEDQTERMAPSFSLLTRRTVLPSDHELRVNPRARSAKMRAAARTDHAAWGPTSGGGI